jgi:NHLM bacteriocin system ABC transporter ATP-binding protein
MSSARGTVPAERSRVLDPVGARSREDQATLHEDALLGACRLVGEVLGLAVVGPTERIPGGETADPASRIAHSSGFRVRRVSLAAGWWADEVGPLVAYRREDGAPLAVLPAAHGRYRVVDPVTRTSAPLTADVAETLAPHADVLCRPLPARPVSSLELLRFGAQGTRRDVWVLLGMGLLGSVLALAVPIATGWLVAELIPSQDVAGLVQLAIALCAVAVGAFAFTLVRDLAVLRIETRVDGVLSAAVLDRMLRLPVPFFRRYEAGDLARRALSLDAARQALTGVAASALLGFVFTVPSMLLLWVLDPVLALTAAVPMAIGLAAFGLVGLAHLRASRQFQEQAGRLAGITFGLIAGIPKLRVAAAEDRALGVWEDGFAGQHVAATAAQRAALALSVIASAVSRIGLAVVFLAAALRLNAGTSAAVFLAFYAAFGQILTATLSLGSAISVTARLLPGLDRVRPILETPPEEAATDRPQPVDPGPLNGAIEAEGVTFGYQAADPPVVDDVSFRVEPGQFVGIVGPSGAGKTTLVRLLLGFEPPAAGTIRYDGHDLAALDVRAVRRQLGVVLQDAALMAGELGANILGPSTRSMDDAWEAARLVGLDDEIRRMPMGMHTFVAEGGAALSAGQRQRILLARELVRRPRILLLDEATSALDAQSQRLVTGNLRSLGITRIVIAHRVTTIVDADLILVMDEGRIAERGTYAELVSRSGRFTDLAQRQLV